MNHFVTRTGLRIGCLAPKSPPPYHDKDALRLQAALINKRNSENGIDWIVISVCLASLATTILMVI